MPISALLLDPSSDPLETAQWYFDFETEYARLVAEDKAQAGETDDDGDAPADSVEDLVLRWKKFSPMTEPQRAELMVGLQAQGFTLTLSEPRVDGGKPRTYMRVLRADGSSAGTLNSTSFDFSGTQHDDAVKGDGRVSHKGKYPKIPLAVAGAVKFILEVTGRFATA